MATIVIKDLLTGVVVGLALSLAKLIYALTHLGIKVSKGHGNRYDVHLSGAATFVRLPYLTDTLDAIPADAEVHVHFKRLNYIDHACMDALADWQKLRAKQGGVVVLEQEELMKMYNLKNTINPKSSASESWDEGNIPASR
jgi:MFS superfamily sulfate permease-like transporter